MKTMRLFQLILALVAATSLATTVWAEKMPTEPIGGKPYLEALTSKNVSPYVVAMTDLRKGPVVLEMPKASDRAMLFGQIADHQYQTFVDLGPIGVDRGKGAKILLTPPDYKGKVPEGYIEVKSVSFRPDFAFRAIPTPSGSASDAAAMAKQIKMYYLSELPNPAPTKMKMTTDIPASITAPDEVQTSIGTLEYFDGVPSEKTVEAAYDYLDR